MIPADKLFPPVEGYVQPFDLIFYNTGIKDKFTGCITGTINRAGILRHIPKMYLSTYGKES